MRTYPIIFTCDLRSYHFGERLILDLLGKRDVPAGVVAEPGRPSGNVPAFETGVVDATGAGDAFFATLVHLPGDPGHPSDEDRRREAT